MSATVIELGEPMFAGEVHPYADLWPMRTADELEAMAESIRANGLRFPIVLSADGVLVDGRNRLRACEIANVTPVWETRPELDSDGAIEEFIWDANGDRRDMSKGAKAMLAALRSTGSTRELSSQSGTSNQYIYRARQVIEFCDDTVIDAVREDRLSLNDAYARAQDIKATVQAEEIAARKAKQLERESKEREAKKLADLRDNRPDLADLVDDGRLDLGEALSLRSKDIAKEAKRAHYKAEAIKQRNLDVNGAFSTITELKHADILAEVQANWRPLSTNWTAPMLHDLADLLHAVADQWEIKQ